MRKRVGKPMHSLVVYNYKDIKYLERLEALRWSAYLSTKSIHQNQWSTCFNELIKHESIYGYGKNGKITLFKSTSKFSYHSCEKEIMSEEDRVRCLEDDELALPENLNNPSDTFQGALKKRISGSLTKYRRDDAWVQKFSKYNILTWNRNNLINNILEVIKLHASYLLRLKIKRSEGNPFIQDLQKIRLELNGRSYIFQKDKFIFLPEYEHEMVTYTYNSYKKEFEDKSNQESFSELYKPFE